MKILITGARSGIAFLTGITLASRGHLVYMTTHTNKEKEKLEEITKELGLNVIVFKLDITNVDDRNLLDYLEIDVLINHAGIGVGGSLLDVSIEDMKHNFDVNYFCSFDIVKRICNKMVKQEKKGKIIIMSSISSNIPLPFMGIYSSTKAAISNLATALRYELKTIKNDVDIVIIEPGAYKTGFNQTIIDDIDKNISEDSVFFDRKNKIHNGLTKIFNLIEKKTIDSIVVKIIEAVESNKPKRVYRAPFFQKIFAKLYFK